MRRISFDIGASPTERSVLFSGVDLSGTAARINEISRLKSGNRTLYNFSLFAQDEWRILPKVNLNLGLRRDADFAPKLQDANVNFQNSSPQMPDGYNNFALRGFGLFQLDASLQRRIKFTNEFALNLSLNAYNLLNNTNFADMSGNLGTFDSTGKFQTNSFFGKTTSTFGSGNFTPFYLYGGQRTIQFSAKLVF